MGNVQKNPSSDFPVTDPSKPWAQLWLYFSGSLAALVTVSFIAVVWNFNIIQSIEAILMFALAAFDMGWALLKKFRKTRRT